MKSRLQKQEELKKGKELFEKSEALVFADITKVKTEDLRKLRRELLKIGAKALVIKKRLLGVLLKEKQSDFDMKQFALSVGTVFAPNVEEASGTVYKFFKELGKGLEKEKILGGYDVKGNAAISKDQILMIGQLPPREVLLAQLAGMIAAPIRSFLYVLSEKSKQ